MPNRENKISNEKNLTPVFTEDYLELQFKEIEVRKEELEMRKMRDENNFEYAKESLKFQAEELKNMRHSETKFELGLMLILSLFILMFFSIVIMAMFLNKDEFLTDLIRAAGYVVGGGITGYGLGLRNGKHKKTNIKQT